MHAPTDVRSHTCTHTHTHAALSREGRGQCSLISVCLSVCPSACVVCLSACENTLCTSQRSPGPRPTQGEGPLSAGTGLSITRCSGESSPSDGRQVAAIFTARVMMAPHQPLSMAFVFVLLASMFALGRAARVYKVYHINTNKPANE